MESETGQVNVYEPDGYDFEFLDELSKDQECPICHAAMRNPVQTAKCGHRFCKNCLLRTFRYDDVNFICPMDNTTIPKEGGFFDDLACGRSILSLRVKCRRSGRGCVWSNELRDYEVHFKTCQLEDVICDDCETKMERKSLAPHKTFQCPERKVPCQYCGEEFRFWYTEVHEGEECARYPLECPQKCGTQKIPREELEAHKRDVCPMTIVPCPYEKAGCTFSTQKMKLGAHIKQSSEDHMLKMNQNLTRLLEENGRMKRSMKALKRKIGGLHEEKEALWEKVSDMERQLKGRDRLLDEREKRMQNPVEALAEEWRNGRKKEKTNRKRKAVEESYVKRNNKSKTSFADNCSSDDDYYTFCRSLRENTHSFA